MHAFRKKYAVNCTGIFPETELRSGMRLLSIAHCSILQTIAGRLSSPKLIESLDHPSPQLN